MQELKTELRFALTYLDSLKLLKDEHSMKASKKAIEHALNLLKIINDRIEIAEIRAAEASAPEARYWKDILNEYGVIYNLERMYNSTPEIEGSKENE